MPKHLVQDDLSFPWLDLADMADVYIKLQQPESALRFAQRLAQQPDVLLWNSVLWTVSFYFVQASDPDRAFQVLSLMQSDLLLKTSELSGIRVW